ncbi:MAG: hypothetical protein O2877_02405, partial [bacterium]|nr:hypothetical protein [bacterium]
AGSGSIATTENFPTGAAPSELGEFSNAGAFVTSIAEPGNMLSFIIGLGMLFAGFEAAQKFSTALPGMAGKLVSGGVKGAIGIGAAATIPSVASAAVSWQGAALAAKAGSAYGAYKLAPTVGKKVGASVSRSKAGQYIRTGAANKLKDWGSDLQDTRLGGGAGRLLSGAGAGLEQSRLTAQAGRINEITKNVSGFEKDDVDKGLKTKAFTPEGRERQQALRMRVFNDSKMLRKYNETPAGQAELKKMVSDFEADGGEEMVNADPAMKEKYEKFQKKRIDLVTDPAKKKDILGAMNRSELLDVDKEALGDPDYQNTLKGVMEYDKVSGEEMSMYDRMKLGRIGESGQQKAIKDFELSASIGGKPEHGSDASIAALSPLQQTDDVLAALAGSKQSDKNPIGRLATAAQNPDFQMQNVSEDIFEDPKSIAALAEAVSSQVVRNMANSGTTEKIKVFRDGAANAIHSGVGTPRQTAALRSSLLSTAQSTRDLQDDVFQYDAGTKKFGGDGAQHFRSAISHDASSLVNFQSEIEGKGDFADYAVESGNAASLISSAHNSSGAEQIAYFATIEKLKTHAEARQKDLQKRSQRLATELENAGAASSDKYKKADEALKSSRRKLASLQINLRFYDKATTT